MRDAVNSSSTLLMTLVAAQLDEGNVYSELPATISPTLRELQRYAIMLSCFLWIIYVTKYTNNLHQTCQWAFCITNLVFDVIITCFS